MLPECAPTGWSRWFGLGSALASAMLKVVDALPEAHRAAASDATWRLLVEPETDLLARRLDSEEVPDTTMTAVRSAVLAGHRLRIHYAAVDRAPAWRTVDPVGLVTGTRFRTGGDHTVVQVRVDPERREDLVGTALAVHSEDVDADGRLRLEVAFQDPRHAEWALWQLATHAEAVAPPWLRTALRDRAAAIAARYREPPRTCREDGATG